MDPDQRQQGIATRLILTVAKRVRDAVTTGELPTDTLLIALANADSRSVFAGLGATPLNLNSSGGPVAALSLRIEASAHCRAAMQLPFAIETPALAHLGLQPNHI